MSSSRVFFSADADEAKPPWISHVAGLLDHEVRLVRNAAESYLAVNGYDSDGRRRFYALKDSNDKGTGDYGVFIRMRSALASEIAKMCGGSKTIKFLDELPFQNVDVVHIESQSSPLLNRLASIVSGILLVVLCGLGFYYWVKPEFFPADGIPESQKVAEHRLVSGQIQQELRDLGKRIPDDLESGLAGFSDVMGEVDLDGKAERFVRVSPELTEALNRLSTNSSERFDEAIRLAKARLPEDLPSRMAEFSDALGQTEIEGKTTRYVRVAPELIGILNRLNDYISQKEKEAENLKQAAQELTNDLKLSSDSNVSLKHETKKSKLLGELYRCVVIKMAQSPRQSNPAGFGQPQPDVPDFQKLNENRMESSEFRTEVELWLGKLGLGKPRLNGISVAEEISQDQADAWHRKVMDILRTFRPVAAPNQSQPGVNPNRGRRVVPNRGEQVIPNRGSRNE